MATAPLLAQLANVQVIHNAADPAAASVDVYVGGNLALASFDFRDATPFLQLPSGVSLPIEIRAAGGSTAVYTTTVGPLASGQNYVLIANGVINPANFDANPNGLNISFDLYANGGRAIGQNTASNVDLQVFHGATDAPFVDVVVRGGSTLIDNLGYTDFQGYATVPAGSYILDVYDSSQTVLVASYLADLSGLGGGAATVVASGFLDGSQGPAFGLYVALGGATTTGQMLQLPLFAPKAKLQVIHNAADPDAASVDVYVNGALAIPGFDFRDATPFIELPAGTPIEVEITPAGSSTVVYSLNLDSLAQNTNYIAIANGVLTPANFTANPDAVSIGFDLYISGSGRLIGQNGSSDVDLLVFHGATDAPTVDVVARGVGPLIDDLSYTDFQGYANVPAGTYILDVYNSDQTVLVASYLADLSGLGGGAATVFASGFLDDSQGPAFGLYVALGGATTVSQTLQLPLYAPTAKLQVIHNAADPDAASVDVYVNGNLAIPGFDFRDATPFIELPAGTPIEVEITPAGNSTVVYSLSLDSLAQNTNYIAIANGVLTPANFTANPDAVSIGFDLYISGQGRLTGQNGSSDVDLLVFHGATDAPTVDVVARGVGPLIDDLSYTDFQGYANVPAGNYILDVYNSDQTVLVASYTADLTGLGGGAATVFASGFLDDSQGPGFGLFVALGGTATTGQTIELPLYQPSASGTANLQVIHNAADPAAASVDVYVNGAVALGGFDFRDVSSFLSLPSGLPLDIEITPAGNSTVVYSLSIDSLEASKNYVLFANGVVNAANFTANPDAVNIELDLFGFEDALTAGAGGTGTADILIFHGATDAPTVDIAARGVGTLADNLSYTDFNPAGYLNVPASEYIIDVLDGSGTTRLLSYYADLTSAAGIPGGAAAVVFASGFLDDSQGPGFGLYVAIAGFPSTTQAIELPLIDSARVQVIHNAADPAAATVDVYIVSTVDDTVIAKLEDFDFRTATPYINLPSNQPLGIAVAPGTSTSVADALATFPTELETGETYVVIANGVLAPGSFTANPQGESTEFDLYITNGKEAADMANMTELLLFHGATDAPTVDIDARGVATIGNDLTYGDFAGYLAVPASSYIIDVNVSAGGATAASYTADLTTLAGGAGVAFASGFLDGAQGPSFGVWVTLPDGTTFPLPTYVGINEKTFTGKLNLYPNPTTTNLVVSLSLDEAQTVNVSLINTLGQVVSTNNLGTIDSGDSNISLDVANLTSGVYAINIQLGNGQQVTRQIVIE
jgi:hypothetical protein